MWAFITMVVTAGVVALLFSTLVFRPYDLVFLLVLIALTLFAELFHINLYGQGTISVTAALIFAAALTVGGIGVALVSMTCAVGARIALYRNEGRPFEPHKVLFNWATHTLAGTIPALILGYLNLKPDMAHIFQLAMIVTLLAPIYYLIETGLIAAIIGLASGRDSIAVWQSQYRWLAGHYMVLLYAGMLLVVVYTQFSIPGLLLFFFPLLVLRYAMHQYTEHTAQSIQELQQINRELAEANMDTGRANQRISALNDELFETLSRFFDARDPFTGGHTFTVAKYATAIARELKLPDEQVVLVRQAAILHDIGKIAISELILYKPGRLTEEEFAQMRLHAEIGATLLEESESLRHLAPFVRHHHERWDGCGYPQGLKAETIPLVARILNVCDSVEAMASDRPYHRAMSPEQVLVEVARCAGTQFDPQLAAIFLQVAEREGPGFIINSARQIDGRLLTTYLNSSQQRKDSNANRA